MSRPYHCFAIGVLLCLPGLAAQAATGAAAPKAVFPDDDFDFGKVVGGMVVEHGFVLRNEGAAPLRIQSVRVTPPLTILPTPAQIAPGDEAVLHFKLDTAGLLGPYNGAVLVSLNDPALPETTLAFEGEVVPTVELSPMPAFWVAAQRGDGGQSSIELINHEPEPLRIEKVEHSSDRFTTKLETLEPGRRYRLTLALNPYGPGGKKSEPILIHTSSKTNAVLKVTANTYLRDRVYTFPEAVDLGALSLSAIQINPDLLRQSAQTLMVYQAGGSNFEVKLHSDLPALDLKLERGPQGDKYQATITLIEDKLQVGPLKGTIFIETNDPQYPSITVPVSGRILDR